MKKIIVLFTVVLLYSISLKADIIERNVHFQNGDLKFGGTLTLPDTVSNHPVLVLVSGSGQQNRDEELFGFKPFKVIAEYLANNGIATLRYDDRGVGESKNAKITIETATTYSFATDAKAAVSFLKNENNIDSKKIAVLGHSEGGLIAAIVAGEMPDDIKCIVMMGGMCIQGKSLTNYQILQQAEESNVDEKQLQEVLKQQNRIYTAIENKVSDEELEKILYETILQSIENMPEDIQKQISNKEEYAKFMSKRQLKQVSSPWTKWYFTHQPNEDFQKVQCPTYALFGEKDQQVPPKLCVEPLKSYYKNKQNLLTVQIIPDANHLFQKAETGSVSEYNKLKKEFTEPFLKNLGEWINNYLK